MSEHAFTIEGLDEITHEPLRIELRLVTEAKGPSTTIKEFAAPRGFLPPEAHHAIQGCDRGELTGCQRQIWGA